MKLFALSALAPSALHVRLPLLFIATALALGLSPARASPTAQQPTLHELRANLADLTRPTLCAARRAQAVSNANTTLQAALKCTKQANKCATSSDVASAHIALSVAQARPCAAPVPAQEIEAALRAFEAAANARALAQGLAPAYDTLVLEPFGETPHVACLSLHSLNSSAEAHAATAAMAFEAGALPASVRVYVPQAPERVVDFFDGQRLASWFNIISESPTGPWASAEIDSAVQNMANLLDADATLFGTDRWKAAVTGYSQGGALAAALSMGARVSASSTVAGFLPDPFSYPRPESSLSATSPMLLVHGDEDRLVPVGLARLSTQLLRQYGRNVTYTELPGLPHNLGDRLFENLNRGYDWIGRAMVPGHSGRLQAPRPLIWTLRAARN